MKDVMQRVRRGLSSAVLCSVCLLWLGTGTALAESKGEKAFQAVATDAKGVETDVHGIIFYWEEKISETSFVPHELKEVPVKRRHSPRHGLALPIEESSAGLWRQAP